MILLDIKREVARVGDQKYAIATAFFPRKLWGLSKSIGGYVIG